VIDCLSISFVVAILVDGNYGVMQRSVTSPVGVRSCLRPVAAGDSLLPCKLDDSVAQLLSGMKKGRECTLVITSATFIVLHM